VPVDTDGDAAPDYLDGDSETTMVFRTILIWIQTVMVLQITSKPDLTLPTRQILTATVYLIFRKASPI